MFFLESTFENALLNMCTVKKEGPNKAVFTSLHIWKRPQH